MWDGMHEEVGSPNTLSSIHIFLSGKLLNKCLVVLGNQNSPDICQCLLSSVFISLTIEITY